MSSKWGESLPGLKTPIEKHENVRNLRSFTQSGTFQHGYTRIPKLDGEKQPHGIEKHVDGSRGQREPTWPFQKTPVKKVTRS